MKYYNDNKQALSELISDLENDNGILIIAKQDVESELDYANKCHKLEEQLGCPLDVYMQIEMNRVNGLYDEKGDFWKFDYVTHTHFRCYRKNGKDEENKLFAVSGYKITWWLKKDKSE